MTIELTRKIGILHRSSKECSVEDTEKLCEIKESVLNDAMKTLRNGGKWKCPFCGIETVADLKKKIVTPMLSTWGVIGLNVEIKK